MKIRASVKKCGVSIVTSRMSVERSLLDADVPPPLPLAPLQIEPSVCHVCHDTMSEGSDCLIITICSHAFHRHCVESRLMSTSECPECRRSCQLSELRKLIISRVTSVKAQVKGKARGAIAKQYNTRSSQRNIFPEATAQNGDNIFNFPATQGLNTNVGNEHGLTSPDRTIQRTPPWANTTSVDYNEINRMIEENLNRVLGNLNLVNSADRVLSTDNVTDARHQANLREPVRQQPRANANDPYTISPIALSNLGSSSMPADRITSVIQNWNLRFDGSSTGLHVDEFLYRIRSLTGSNFNGDLSVVCKNLHILLTGKARDWYWRYHKQVQSIQWDDFCDAIRSQYKE